MSLARSAVSIQRRPDEAGDRGAAAVPARFSAVSIRGLRLRADRLEMVSTIIVPQPPPDDRPPSGGGRLRRSHRATTARARKDWRPSISTRVGPALERGSRPATAGGGGTGRRGAAAASFALATPTSTAPAVLAWTPPDSVAYVEARLDLPGGQRDALASFLRAFPGGDDPNLLGSTLTGALDRLVDKASRSKVSYSADIAPWFGGQVSLSVGPLPD